MGQQQGRTALRHLYWACLIVIIDIGIRGFDLLPDPVGYLLLGNAAHRLAQHERSFRVVQVCSYILALFSIAGLIRSTRRAPGTLLSRSGGSGLSWSQPGVGNVPVEQGVPIAVLLGVIGAAVSLCLVWFLFTGIARVAAADGLADFAFRVRVYVRWAIAAMVGLEILAWALLATGLLKAVTALVIVAGIASILFGILALKAIWEASNDLLFTTPEPADHKLTLARPLIWLGTLGVAAAIGAIALAVSDEPYDPNSPANAASRRQPPGMSDRDQLIVDVSDPSSFRQVGGGYTFDFSSLGDCGWLSQLDGIDLDQGEILWSLQIPAQMTDRLMVLDDSVMILDERVGYLPPSLSAIDSSTGDLRWQYYLSGANARFYGLGDDTVAVSTGDFYNRDRGEVIVFDGQGQVVDRFDDDLIGRHSAAGSDTPGHELSSVLSLNYWRPPGPYEIRTGYFANLITTAPDANGYQALLNWQPDRSLVYRNSRTGETRDVDPIGSDTIGSDTIGSDTVYTKVGNSNSPGLALQHNEALTMVLLGSEQGPNSKLTVFDTASGNRLWTSEHVRSAALSGANIVYDKRNEAEAGADVTRTLHLVDGQNSDHELWSTDLAVNEAGGNGYLGTILTVDGDRLVFVVEDEDGEDSFLLLPTIPQEKIIPEVVRAGGVLGGGPSNRSHVDQDILIAAGQTEVIWQHAGHPVRYLGLGHPGFDTDIRALALVDGILVVESRVGSSCDVDLNFLD